MGRLINTNISTGSSTLNNSENLDIHIFLDKSGNVIQIKKETKDKLKFYIDPVLPPDNFRLCAIGIGDPFGDDCTEGVAMGLNDNDLMANANYL